MAPRLTQHTATANKLVDVMTLHAGAEQSTNDKGQTKPYFTSISYFPDGKQMVVGSTDNSARQWDLQTGKEIAEARFVCELKVRAVAVSRDGQWVISSGGDVDYNDKGKGEGEVKACEVETGMMKTFEGHSKVVTCIDVSADNKLLASGSWDHTARIWDLNTGKLVAGPFECGDRGVGAVRFSQDSKKLAVKSGYRERCLEVCDIQEQKLNRRVGKGGGGIMPDTPVFWTTNDRSIVAAFRFEADSVDPTKIYEFDASTLETVGAPFEGHYPIIDVALSLDCALLASASSSDNTIKLWAFESRQLLASFDFHSLRTLILSPNSRQLAYTEYDQPKIHVCDIPSDILTRLWPEQATCSTLAPDHSHHTEPLNSHPTRHPTTVRRIPVSWSPAPRPLRSSHPEQPTWVRQLRKLLPSYFRKGQITLVRNDEPRDPLDFPATSRLPSLSAEAVTQVHSGMNPGEQHYPHAVTQFVEQNLSFSRTGHEPAVVEVAADRQFTRLAVVNLPEYRKVNDTRRSSPAVPQGTAENDAPHHSSDNDSLPDVHWCKTFFCYCSCWSHGALRMPPRWRLEHIDEPQSGTRSHTAGKADDRS